MPVKLLKVKVLKCRDVTWWYRNVVGESFEVRSTADGVNYVIMTGVYKGSYLARVDCDYFEVLKSNAPVKTRRIRCL